RSRRTGRTLRARLAGWPALAPRSLGSGRARFAVGPRLAPRARLAPRSRGPRGPLLAGRSPLALRARGPDLALRTGRARLALRAGRAELPGRSCRTGLTRRSRLPDCALRPRRPGWTGAVGGVEDAVAVHVLAFGGLAVAVEVPAHQPVPAGRAGRTGLAPVALSPRLTSRPRRSRGPRWSHGAERAGRPRRTGRALRSGRSLGSLWPRRSLLPRGPGRPRRSRLACRPRLSGLTPLTRRAGWSLQGALGDSGAQRLHLRGHRPQPLLHARLAALQLRVHHLHRRRHERRRLEPGEELVATQAPFRERLAHAERRHPRGGPGCPVVRRDVVEGEAGVGQARHGVRGAAPRVRPRQPPVDQHRRLVTRHGVLTQERPVREPHLHTGLAQPPQRLTPPAGPAAVLTGTDGQQGERPQGRRQPPQPAHPRPPIPPPG